MRAAVPRDQMRREIADAGFDPITTFGDFAADYDLGEVGFLAHVARRVT